MDEIEIIQGDKILCIFEELQQDGTLLKLRLPAKHFEQLTRIMAIRQRRNTSQFLIDYPDGFIQAAADMNIVQLEFEYTGRDKVKHTFQTDAADINQKKIWINIPRVIGRKQRRKQFRIEAPAGTKISFCSDSVPFELKVIDISLGGSLGILAGAENSSKPNPVLERNKLLKDIQLIFPPENENICVNVKRAEIKRLGENPLTGQCEYALAFLKLKRDDQKVLNECIYSIQREYLRNRLRIDA